MEIRSSLKLCLPFVFGAMLLDAAPWAPPRTPWGDPDLQGTYANNNEYATPLERPAEFAGKRASDLTAAEIAEARRQAQQRMIAALPGGDVRGPDDWWLQNLDVSKRSRLWSVVDPPDGKIPPLTPAGQARASSRVRSSFVGGPFDGPEDLNFLERCITKGVPGVMIPWKSSNEMMLCVASEQCLIAIADGPPTVPLVKGGQIRALAVTGSERSETLPTCSSARRSTTTCS